MGSEQQTVDFILGQIANAGNVSAKKMFGEFGIYCDGRMVGVVCDDKLFIKSTEAGRGFFKHPEEHSPYPGAKPHLLVPGDRLDESDWLIELVRVSARALPEPVARRGTSRR